MSGSRRAGGRCVAFGFTIVPLSGKGGASPFFCTLFRRLAVCTDKFEGGASPFFVPFSVDWLPAPTKSKGGASPFLYPFRTHYLHRQNRKGAQAFFCALIRPRCLPPLTPGKALRSKRSGMSKKNSPTLFRRFPIFCRTFA